MTIVASPKIRAIACILTLALTVLVVLAPQSVGSVGEQAIPSDYRAIALLDQNGEQFSLSDFEDMPTVVNFVFTGCRTYCPVQTGALSAVYDDLKDRAPDKRFKLVSITLTPVFDGPREMKSYAEPFSEGRSDWVFATGDPDQIEGMLEQLQLEVYYGDRPQIDVLHETDIFVLQNGTNEALRFEGIPLDHEGIKAAVLAR